MALRTEHVQAAQLAHLLALGLDGLFRGRESLGPRLAVLLRVFLRVEALGSQVRLGEELRVTTQHDVSTTAGHVRGHRDRALAAGHRDDGGFAGVLLGVEHLVRNVLLLEHLGKQLGLFHRSGTDEDRLAGLVTRHDVLDDRVQFALLRRIDEVGLILADHRLVRGDRDDVDLVGRVELRGLGLSRTGHAGTRALGVQTEVVLQRDRSERLVLGLDLHAFLGLDRLVHAVVVAAARQDTARVLVNDENLAAVHDVVAVLKEQLLGADRVVEEADQRGVRRLVEVLNAQLVLDLVDARLQDADGLLLFVDLVVLVALQQARDAGELHVPAVQVTVSGTRNDEGGTGLIDEDRVNLVDDDEGMATLDQILRHLRHVVAQVVEAKLVVRTVGDVAGVHLAALSRRLPHEDTTAGQAQEVVDAAHDVRLVLRQVVVDRHNVHTLAGQRAQVRGHRGDQGLAFTGLHFGDLALVQGNATHDLHVEGTHAQDSPRGLTDRRKRLDQDVVQGLAILEAILELLSLSLQLLVRQSLKILLQGINLRRKPIQLAQHTPFASAKDLVNNRHE